MVNIPPEESAGGIRWTDDGCSDAAGGGGRLTDTDREEAKVKKKKREETGEMKGASNPGESWREGKGEGGDQNHHWMGIIAN